MRPLPREFRGPRWDRSPVSTYEQAVAWLFQGFGFGENPLRADEPLPVAAYLVCDLFWCTERMLRQDLAKKSRQYWESLPVPGPRRSFRRGAM